MADMPLGEPLRAQLRDVTKDAHARLDGLMGDGMQDRDQYGAYLRGMHCFVRSLSPSVEAQQHALGWTIADWEDALAADLQALGAGALASETLPARDRDGALGALYVVEGSALGARLLVRQARALGYSAERGAAFLHAHAEGDHGQRWPRFLALLAGPRDNAARHAACDAALDTFALAERCFRRAKGELK